MKRIIPIFFLLAFVTASLKQYYPYLDYYINKKYIVENFCVNKDKPEMGCEGKCHLKKQLEKTNPENNSDLPVPPSNNEETLVLFFEPIKPCYFIPLNKDKKIKSIFISNIVRVLYQDVPKPPPKFL